jgi:hypothetical protein
MALADRSVSLIEEGFDLVVRMGHIADSGLMFRRIASIPRILVASPTFLRSCSDLSGPDDLRAVPALAIRRELVEWPLRHADGRVVTVSPRGAILNSDPPAQGAKLHAETQPSPWKTGDRAPARLHLGYRKSRWVGWALNLLVYRPGREGGYVPDCLVA